MRWCVSRSRGITNNPSASVHGHASGPGVEGLEARLCLSGYLLVSSFDNNSVVTTSRPAASWTPSSPSTASPTILVGLLFGPDGQNDGKLDLYVTSAVATLVRIPASSSLTAAPGTSEVLRYNGTTGGFVDTFVAPDSGGLQFPTFMTFTETDPTTLNYVAPQRGRGDPRGTSDQRREGVDDLRPGRDDHRSRRLAHGD